MLVYHYTTKCNWKSIQTQGLIPSDITGQGERLPFVMFSIDMYYPYGPCGFVYLEIELDANDSRFHMVNKSWGRILRSHTSKTNSPRLKPTDEQ